MTIEFIPGDFVRVWKTLDNRDDQSDRLGIVLGSGEWYLSETRDQPYVTVLVTLPEGSKCWNVRPDRLELVNEPR